MRNERTMIVYTKWNDKSGFSYFFALSFAIIMMVISGGVQFGASVHSNLAKRQSNLEEAFLLAEAGIEYTLEELVSNNFF